MPIFKQDYKVLVRCFTFNHSKYIKDALDGFVMQKTDFPFVCAIVDDCSTDGEQDVIKSYLDTEFNMDSAELCETDYANIIVAKHKTNINCSFVVFFLKYNHYSIKKQKTSYLLTLRDICSYEAICEGDDFWTDEKKLQKQYDWMEQHPDYSMCWHDAYCENGGVCTPYNRFSEDCDVSFEDMVFNGGAFCPTASLFIRESSLAEYNSELKKRKYLFHVGDYPLQIYMRYIGKVRYIKDKMSVYRICIEGSWTSKRTRLSEEGKIAYIKDKAILLLDKMNDMTDFEYDEVFQQQKKRVLLNLYLEIGYVKDAMRMYCEIDSKNRLSITSFFKSLVKSLITKFRT